MTHTKSRKLYKVRYQVIETYECLVEASDKGDIRRLIEGGWGSEPRLVDTASDYYEVIEE